jgi:glutamyl-tRNA synthetase
LGFSHGNDEVFSVAQLIEWFALENLNSAPARFDAQKFEWFNTEHIKRLPAQELGQALAPFLPENARTQPDKHAAIADLLRDRATTLKHMAEQTHYFFARPKFKPGLKESFLTPTTLPLIEQTRQALSVLNTWDKTSLSACLKSVMSDAGIKPPALFMPLRVLLAGTTTTPGVDAIMAILGKEESLARLKC